MLKNFIQTYISFSTSGGETINVGAKQIRIALYTHIRTHTLRVICNLCLKRRHPAAGALSIVSRGRRNKGVAYFQAAVGKEQRKKQEKNVLHAAFWHKFTGNVSAKANEFDFLQKHVYVCVYVCVSAGLAVCFCVCVGRTSASCLPLFGPLDDIFVLVQQFAVCACTAPR